MLVLGALIPSSTAAEAVGETDGVAVPERSAGRQIAVLPLHNRSGVAAPLQVMRRFLAQLLEAKGLSVLEQEDVEDFMRRNRMRYTAGLNRTLARAMERETGARAALLASLDLYQESNPPKVGITARLVSTGPDPQILWMDSAAESGDQSPGFFELGLVDDVDVLLARVIDRLADSVWQAALAAAGEPGRRAKDARARRFRPKVAFSSPEVAVLAGASVRVAVLPLANESTTRYAGEILTDLLIRSLLNAGADVLEPGVVRQVLLETRQIQPKGPSIPQVDLLRVNLNVERILFGEVGEYLEASAGRSQAVVDFSVRVMDTSAQQMIFSSISHTGGDDGVFFFDARRIATAHDLASQMVQALVFTLRRSGTKHRAGALGETPPDRPPSSLEVDSRGLETTSSSSLPARSGWYHRFPQIRASQDLP